MDIGRGGLLPGHSHLFEALIRPLFPSSAFEEVATKCGICGYGLISDHQRVPLLLCCFLVWKPKVLSGTHHSETMRQQKHRNWVGLWTSCCHYHYRFCFRPTSSPITLECDNGQTVETFCGVNLELGSFVSLTLLPPSAFTNTWTVAVSVLLCASSMLTA